MAQMKCVVAAAITVTITMVLINGITADTTFTVGDDMGWTVPDSSPDFYSTWATKHNFAVGDSLVFQFPTGFHDVAEVSKAGYDDCDAGDVEAQTEGPVVITLDRSGSHYYICTFGNGDHCNNGQKVAINVTSATTVAEAPSPAAISPSPEPNPVASDLGSSPPMSLTSTFFSVSFIIAFVIALLH